LVLLLWPAAASWNCSRLCRHGHTRHRDGFGLLVEHATDDTTFVPGRSGIQCSAVQRSAVERSAVERSAVQRSAVER
jgi:hypothetical protein